MSSNSFPPGSRPVAEVDNPPQQRVITVHLQKIPLLSGVSETALKDLTASLQIRAANRGDYVLHKGAVGDFLIFILSGRLQVIDLTQDGREIGLNFLTPGDYFGELSIIDGLPRSASVIATEASLLGLLPRAQALGLILNNPIIAERILKKMAASIRAASNYRAILGIPNAFQRVFAFLNSFAKTAPGGLVVIEKIPTQQEIAITVNTSRETVSRAIQSLIQKGVLEKDYRRLIVRDPEILREALCLAPLEKNEP